ncbi:short chain dehydrogenase [Nemania diffusa]|nr:short chain dehydrogenase [Nemania diffusa]
MAEVIITDESLASLKDNVVVVTGCASGIGLAAVQHLLSLGASVIGSDLHPPPDGAVASPHFTFQVANVSSWPDLVAVFKTALSLHGRVDHVFANAGMGPRTDYVSGIELDEHGDPQEPTSIVLDVNLKGAINTTALAVHYIRQNPRGTGSVVINASATGLQRFRSVDYVTSKHGTIGLMRGMHAALTAQSLPVRVNAVAPSWTSSSIVREPDFARAGVYTQAPGAVARAALGLMADGGRRGHLVHVDHGVCREVDEAVMLPAYDALLHEGTMNEDQAAGLVMASIMRGAEQGE